MVARGTSYRAHDADLIAFEQPWARLDAVMDDDSERIIKLVQDPRPSKSYDINGKPLSRLCRNTNYRWCCLSRTT